MLRSYRGGRAFYYDESIEDAALAQAAGGVLAIYREELELCDDELTYDDEVWTVEFGCGDE